MSAKRKSNFGLTMIVSFLILALALALAACGGGDSGAGDSGSSVRGSDSADNENGAAGGAESAADPEKGRVVFEASCVACHGADGKGVPGIGKDLVNKSEWMAKQSDADLASMIKQGRSVSDPENTTGIDMPPKGGNPALSDQDIQNLVAYIRSMQK